MSHSPPETGYPFIIEKFTMAIDLIQDRIRMNVFNSQDGVKAIWLTRRLLDRLLPLIIKQIEDKVGTTIAAQFDLSASQQKLRTEREVAGPKPVVPVAEDEPWLATQMRFLPHHDGYVWVLLEDMGHEARFFLTDESLRSALDILYITYMKMEWNCDAFPDWVVEISRGRQTSRFH